MLHGLALLAATSLCTSDPQLVRLADPRVPKTVYKTWHGPRLAVVAVTLDPAGTVTNASIFQSSGDERLDDAAVDAARRSTYSTSTANCAPSGGTFAVRFNFVGQGPATDEACEREARPVQVTGPRVPSIDEDAYVTVEATIGPDGQLQEAHVSQSSGNALVDRAALRFAMRAKYVPKFVTAPVRRQAGAGDESDDGLVCRPATGKYVFRIHFTPRR